MTRKLARQHVLFVVRAACVCIGQKIGCSSATRCLHWSLTRVTLLVVCMVEHVLAKHKMAFRSEATLQLLESKCSKQNDASIQCTDCLV